MSHTPETGDPATISSEHGFTHQVVELVPAITEGRDPRPSFADGPMAHRVLAAVEESSATRQWQEIPA